MSSSASDRHHIEGLGIFPLQTDGGFYSAACEVVRSSLQEHGEPLGDEGVLIQDDSRLLGHHSISETEAAYAYLAPDRMQPQVNAICQVDIEAKSK